MPVIQPDHKMRFYIKFFLIAFFLHAAAIAQDATELFENGKAYMKKGDYANATIAFTKALESQPGDKNVSKELALSYYYQGDNNKALAVVKPLLELDNADDQVYQIAGDIYRALKQQKEASLIYRRGIVKMPESGLLYNALGEVMWESNDPDAIKEWEKGIEEDPAYSKNYYNASKFYFGSSNTVWSILYGEIFLNMEPFSNKSPEVKDMLLESYRKMFGSGMLDKENSKFESAYLQTMNKQSQIASSGIDPESLTMIRTRFILDWFNENKRPAFKLFDYQRQLLQEGLFDAYNQWIFGSAQNLAYFQNWINAHPEEYAALTNYQKNRVFRIEPGEYYKK